MSREAHLRAVEFTYAALIELRTSIAHVVRDKHSHAAAMSVESVGLPEDDTTPAGRLIATLARVKEQLDEAQTTTNEAIDALQDYERRL